MSARYYHGELDYLRGMGAAFAKLHPTTAGLLAERGSDPDVERLLEGFAFLTAKIRERIDDALPEAIHGLAQVAAPQLLRPVPSLAMIEYAPDLRTHRGCVDVARGTRVLSRAIRGKQCEFRTTRPVSLLPLRLRAAEVDQTRGSKTELRLGFETNESLGEALAESPSLPIFLHGELATTGTLLLWLTRYCVRVGVIDEQGHRHALDPRRIRHLIASSTDALLPWPESVPAGFRVLQEYIAFPQSMMFVELGGLESLSSLEGERFELVFEFEGAPEIEGRVDASNFRLFCTPVVNLFETTAEPLRHDGAVQEHLLRAAGVDPEQMEVYEVTGVLGIRRGRPEPVTYFPFERYEAQAPGASSFSLRRSNSILDDGTDVYLRVHDGGGEQTLSHQETLSVTMVCTNRSWAARVQLGEICETPRGSSSPAPFQNITTATVPLRPPLDGDLQWRLMAHLFAARTTWARPETLKRLVGLYNLQPESVRGQALTRRIDAIASIDSEGAVRVLQGAPVRGVRTILGLADDKIGSLGEAFVFGCVLNELFAGKTALNSFHELRLNLIPSGRRVQWTARTGRHELP